MQKILAQAAAVWALSAMTVQAFAPVLPTDNDALFRGQPERFYMYVDRNFEGTKSTPWQGGTYGFQRGPERIGGKVVLTKFHEGIDIAPTRRDAKGEPLDDVRAIEAGRVVHTSNLSNDSNYGKYVVVEHLTENAPVYTLYSHLATIDVARGQSVTRGSRLGRLGYTGAGIDQRRAHLHLEIAIMWNDGYEGWHDAHFSLPNKHGIFNGMNLMGLDVAEFYLQQRKNPALTLSQFMAKQPVFFKVHLPASPHFQLPRRYPWLVRGSAAKARSWVISFTDAGFPLAIEPSGETISHPRLIWAKPSKLPYAKVTRGLLDGPPGQPQLGENARKLLQLISWDPAAASPQLDSP
jgi:murein DD-endopeptidase MepM/ murein hydrolase activator NlpD